MILTKNGQAGTLESSDVLVMVAPASLSSGIQLELESVVEKQYGDQIKSLVKEILKQKDINDIKIRIQDRGSLEYCLKARIETALYRASK